MLTKPGIAPTPRKNQVFYAIVQHDFEAERADELDAKRGDAVTVVAQSNREWFVAKPIGKLGRPGLIPVSFVEIHDPTTGKVIPDVTALMDRGDLPKVEDWKRDMFNYKNNSITLGVLDSPSNRESVPNSPFITQKTVYPPPEPAIRVQDVSPDRPSYPPSEPPRINTPDILPEGVLLSADVVSFHYEMDEYWFRIHAVFQPYAPLGSRDLPPSKQLILFRVYNDFYDFQVALLDTFPREAGREPPHPRILPFMPGPATNVDDALTAARRSELDEYLHTLCDLSTNGAVYVLESGVIREFLSLKPGDVDTEGEPRVEELEALFADDYQEEEEENVMPLRTNDGYVDEVQGSMGRLKMQDDYPDNRSEGSEYEDEGYAPSPQRKTHDRHPYSLANERRPDDNNLRLHAHTQNHQRNGSSSSINHQQQYSNSRSNSPNPDRTRYNSSSTTRSHNQSSPSVSSMRLSSHNANAPSMGGRSRSQSNATNNFNTPPISAANPQTAFVKIKVFDRNSEDLIAIRVHPRVSHAELVDKVQARLGADIELLKYRDSLTNTLIELDSDHDLRLWMESTEKYVLYAN